MPYSTWRAILYRLLNATTSATSLVTQPEGRSSMIASPKESEIEQIFRVLKSTRSGRKNRTADPKETCTYQATWLTLLRVKPKESQAKVTGEVRYLSYKGSPLKFYCSEHSLVYGSPSVWLLVGDKFLRCRLNKRTCFESSDFDADDFFKEWIYEIIWLTFDSKFNSCCILMSQTSGVPLHSIIGPIIMVRNRLSEVYNDA